MKKILQTSHWLYLFAAVMLLMQSFALWHDVEHPFYIDRLNHSHAHHHDSHLTQPHSPWHDASASSDESKAQCERLNAFINHPGLDNLAQINLLFSPFLTEIFSVYHTLFFSKRRDTYAIRAPPSLLS